MLTPHTSFSRPATRAVLFALGALGLALFQAPALRAAGDPALRPLADAAAALPVTATFDKSADSGPYVMNLTNTSKDTLKVTVTILLSMPSHADHKTRAVPEHAIEAGQVWTVTGLAAGDKVTVAADGFAPLETTVP